MKVLAIFLSCLSSAFVFAERAFHSKNVSEERSSMQCLDEINGRPIPGFKYKESKYMPWREFPCMDGGIAYCTRLMMSKVDRNYCQTKCCMKKTTQPVPLPETSEVATGKDYERTGKGRDFGFVTMKSHTDKKHRENGKLKGSSAEATKNDSNEVVLYSVIVVLLCLLVICGICLFRCKLMIRKLDRKIRRPITHPYDSAGAETNV